MKSVYKFHFNCGRHGKLYGLFVEEREKVDWLIKSGVEVYFGEVLGKHSEIYGPVDLQDITKVSFDENVVNTVLDNNLEFGFNPFNQRLLHQDGDGGEYDDMTIGDYYDYLQENKSRIEENNDGEELH
jgi:hypothetical protein